MPRPGGIDIRSGFSLGSLQVRSALEAATCGHLSPPLGGRRSTCSRWILRRERRRRPRILIPKKYKDQGTSGLDAEVKTGDLNEFKFELKD